MTHLRSLSACLLPPVILAFASATIGCGDASGEGGGSTGTITGAASVTTQASATGPTTTTQTTQASGSTKTASSSTGGSPGCGNAAAPTGEAVREIEIQGVTRRYIVNAPAVIDPDAPLALVFVFHGNGGNGQASQGMGLQNADGAADAGVFVFPDGLPFMNFGVGWNGACDGYDMELFAALIQTLSSDYCIDPGKIFAAGFSWGGDMCQSLACCRGDVVRAVAPASGPELYPPNQQCPGTVRPAMRMTYATNDAYPPQMFADRIDWYREEQGCEATSTDVPPEPCIAYDGCAQPVVACEYEGLGHAWPADWADETWRFFTELP